MSGYRILIFSNARPSRAWGLAERITREIEAIEICGIVQIPTQDLPMAQQLIMDGRSSNIGSQWFRKPFSLLRVLAYGAVDTALSIIHARRTTQSSVKFTPDHLGQQCSAKGIPFLIANNTDDMKVIHFVAEQQPDLAIVLGQKRIPEQLLKVPRRGWVSMRQSVAPERAIDHPAGTVITLEWLATDVSSCPLARLTLPHQRYDDTISISLKADLLCDDLAVESVRHFLDKAAGDAAGQLKRWIQAIFSPYLQQLPRSWSTTDNFAPDPRWRPTWKLFLDTLLLCSPSVFARNWYRKVRCRYPITILTHHLVSDREHRMGISTQAFWRQVRFLQRHYRVVSLGEAVELLKSGHVDTPTVVLTFDDGYADNFLSLRAVAHELGIPVTLFLATEPISVQQEFQHDLDNGIRGAMPLTWQQLRYWSSGPVEFGAHTRTHFDCGSTNRPKLEFEIAGSKLDLEEKLQRSVDFFAFPFGQLENMSAESIQVARTYYPYFLSGFGGDNHCRTCNKEQHLLRKNLYANAWEMELELQGIFDMVDKIRSLLSPRKKASTPVEQLGLYSSPEISKASNSQEPIALHQ